MNGENKPRLMFWKKREKREYNHAFPDTVKFLKSKKPGECCGSHDKCGTYEVYKVGKKMICKKCDVEVVLKSESGING